MAYQTNPTFVNGTVLTAAQLNILSQNIEFLYSLVSGINTPFTGEKLVASGNTRIWTFRHQSRYLHYKFRLMTGDSDETDIRLDGVNVGGDATNRTSPYTWEDVIDLDGIGSPPAVGDFYELYVEYTEASGPSSFIVDYFIESSSATL